MNLYAINLVNPAALKLLAEEFGVNAIHSIAHRSLIFCHQSMAQAIADSGYIISKVIGFTCEPELEGNFGDEDPDDEEWG